MSDTLTLWKCLISSEKIWRSADLSIWWSDSLRFSENFWYQIFSDSQIIRCSDWLTPSFFCTSGLCFWYQIFSDNQIFPDLQNFCQVADVQCARNQDTWAYKWMEKGKHWQCWYICTAKHTNQGPKSNIGQVKSGDKLCQNIWALRGKLTRLIILVITFDILMSYLQINILYSYPAISSCLDLVRTHPSFVVTRSNTACEF